MKTHKKIITGFVVQDYITLSNGTTVCQSQEFIAGDQVDYEDKDGNPVKVDTVKEVCCSFEMVKPKQINQDGLKFICPECQGTRLECCEDGPYNSEVLSIDEEGDFEYGEISCSGMIERYQCLHCGFVPTNSDGSVIDDNQDVVEWIRENCEQK